LEASRFGLGGTSHFWETLEEKMLEFLESEASTI
jgi:hypothetical protein